MARIIQAPNPFDSRDTPTIFLAGSIDNGSAENWQSTVCEALADRKVTLLNPRRDDWQPTWTNQPDDPHFREQVAWELDALEAADSILMVFTATSKAPVTLLELGLHARRGAVTIVCPPQFWRYGNVALVAERFQIPLFTTLKEGLAAIGATLSHCRQH